NGIGRGDIQQSPRDQLLVEAEGRGHTVRKRLATKRVWRYRRQARAGRDQKTTDHSLLQNGRDERQSRKDRLIVQATPATDHRSPVLEWVVCKTESGAEIIAVTRRARRLQFVVVA